MVDGTFIKLLNGNYVNTRYIFSMYAFNTPSGWQIDIAGGEGGGITLGTLDTPLFSTEAKAQQFIQQILRGFDPNTLVDL
jgi:hypothetical protein